MAITTIHESPEEMVTGGRRVQPSDGAGAHRATAGFLSGSSKDQRVLRAIEADRPDHAHKSSLEDAAAPETPPRLNLSGS